MKSPVPGPNGQDEAFEKLYRQHYRLVYRAAHRVTENPEDALDVLQTVFMKLLAHQERIEGAGNMEGFLHQTALHEALHLLRGRQRRRIDATLDDVEQIAAPDPSIDERQSLRSVLTKMKPEDVELLILHHEQGYSHAEIAKMKGCLTVTVSVNLLRAKRRAKKLLLAEEPAPATPRKGVRPQLSTGGER